MTNHQFRILGVCGSMRERSRSALALGLAQKFASEHGAETRTVDLRTADLPLYRPDREAESPAKLRLDADMHWADAFILASPDYHGSMSGTMKNFLDYYGAGEWAGKLFGYICSSHEKGLTAMDQMRTAVRQCYGWSMPYGVSLDSRGDFDPEGELKNERVERRLRMMARDLMTYGALIRGQFIADLAGEESNTFAATYRK